jgi:hypothetical protein
MTLVLRVFVHLFAIIITTYSTSTIQYHYSMNQYHHIALLPCFTLCMSIIIHRTAYRIYKYNKNTTPKPRHQSTGARYPTSGSLAGLGAKTIVSLAAPIRVGHTDDCWNTIDPGSHTSEFTSRFAAHFLRLRVMRDIIVTFFDIKEIIVRRRDGAYGYSGEAGRYEEENGRRTEGTYRSSSLVDGAFNESKGRKKESKGRTELRCFLGLDRAT